MHDLNMRQRNENETKATIVWDSDLYTLEFNRWLHWAADHPFTYEVQPTSTWNCPYTGEVTVSLCLWIWIVNVNTILYCSLSIFHTKLCTSNLTCQERSLRRQWVVYVHCSLQVDLAHLVTECYSYNRGKKNITSALIWFAVWLSCQPSLVPWEAHFRRVSNQGTSLY